MKTKTFFLTMLIFVFLLTCSTGIRAQTSKSILDQFKLMQQLLGTWQRDIGKDTIEVWETQQYGKSFITNVSLIIKGKKSPNYINNYCIDSKEGNIKGFLLTVNGDYSTWIGLFNTEKKCSVDMVQNFKPETVSENYEFLYETTTNMTATGFNKAGTKISESKFTKVK
jgi:hypothetical protein